MTIRIDEPAPSGVLRFPDPAATVDVSLTGGVERGIVLMHGTMASLYGDGKVTFTMNAVKGGSSYTIIRRDTANGIYAVLQSNVVKEK